jgi:hypothetical protein
MTVSSENPVTMGVAIYCADQWDRFLASAQDREKLAGTWLEWREVLEESKRNMRAIGIEPIEVLVDVDELTEYCAKQGLPNIGGTRAQFVAECLARIYGGPGQ